MAVIWVTTVKNESSEAAGSAVPGGSGAQLAPVRPRSGEAGWGPGAGSEVAAAGAASGTSAGGALALPPLARRPPPTGPWSPRPAGPGRRRRGHVALGPAAAGTYLPRATSRSPPRGPSGPGGGEGAARPGCGRQARPQRRLARGRSPRKPAQPRRVSRLQAGAPRPAAGGWSGCFLPTLVGSSCLRGGRRQKRCSS